MNRLTTDQKVWIAASLAGMGGIVYACLKPSEGFLQKWQRQQLENKLLALEPEDLVAHESTTAAIDAEAGIDTAGEPFKKLVDAVKDALGFEEDDVEAA